VVIRLQKSVVRFPLVITGLVPVIQLAGMQHGLDCRDKPGNDNFRV